MNLRKSLRHLTNLSPELYITLRYKTIYTGLSMSNFKDHYGDVVIKQCRGKIAKINRVFSFWKLGGDKKSMIFTLFLTAITMVWSFQSAECYLKCKTNFLIAPQQSAWQFDPLNFENNWQEICLFRTDMAKKLEAGKWH